MAGVSSEQNIDNDDLTCPITMELFHDPVIASDGRVYERAAITQWINEHGTSPFTRQPLQVNELQPDDHLRQLAARRRNPVVSYNVQHNTVTLPPLRIGSRNARRIHPQERNNTTAAAPVNNESHKCAVCMIIFCGMGFCGVVLLIILLIVFTPSKTTESGFSSSSK